MPRKIIPDHLVFHIWRHPRTGKLIELSPGAHEEIGTPLDTETETEYEYLRTEVEFPE